MATKTRIANKTQWALKDILDACDVANKAWEKADERAQGSMDVVMVRSLGKIRDKLAIIERKADMALRGEYDQER